MDRLLLQTLGRYTRALELESIAVGPAEEELTLRSLPVAVDCPVALRW